MKISRKQYKKVIYSGVFFLLSLIMLMPFIVMVSTSLKSPAEINTPTVNLIPSKFMFGNYVTAMKSGNWVRWFFNSVYVTAFVTIVSLFFNSLSGFAFSRLDFRGRNFMFYSTLLGLMIPQQIIMVPVFIILKNFPFFGGNNLLGQGGIGLVDSYAGLMLPGLAGAFGVFMCRQYFLNFPKALDEAAEIDGCSTFRLYFQIYLPLSKPLFASLGVLKMTSVWNDYVWPLIITNSDSMRTVQLAITIFRNQVVQWELLMAGTTVVTVPLILVFILAQRFFIQGLMAGGVKG